MFTIFSRIIHFGLKNFWRNGWLSTATVAVMVLALLMFAGLIVFNAVTDQAVTSIQDKIDIAVYFKEATPEDDILKIKQNLETREDVKSIDYVSRDAALEEFKRANADDPTITQAINELQENPLQASLRIKANTPGQYKEIADFLRSESLDRYVSEVSYFEHEVAINRLNAIIENVNRGGLVLTILMSLVAGLVVFNTIWIAIYSNRDEISIMRAVGASNALVRGPYMVEGIVAGLIAGVMSVIVAIPFVHFASDYIRVLIPDFILTKYFYGNIVQLLLYLVLFGAAIGSASSFVAVRRYLRK